MLARRRNVNVTSVLGRIASGGAGGLLRVEVRARGAERVAGDGGQGARIRVTIVEPGVTATPAFKKQETGLAPDSPYPHPLRLRAMFAASLLNPVPASVVGEAIRDIVAGDSWQLRYPVGPGASGFLQWRESLTDEGHVRYGALDHSAEPFYLAPAKEAFVKPTTAKNIVAFLQIKSLHYQARPDWARGSILPLR